MKSNDKDARERIIEVTLNLLNEVDDIEEITVRKIAERANVGVGLINYHFKTKDNLLSTAIGDVMSNIIAELYDDSVYTLRPIEDLKNLLKKLCDTEIWVTNDPNTQ
ncbi:MAG: TetR/AcrR family transcriptional regulator, partial [Clostridioides difficile]|nr:TetR/AcrR family transcriptional regulator [Clostridioides difficile]